jgi:hypothetical protein
MKSRTINDFTMNDVHSLFDSDILHRGEEYCDEGCVTFIGPSDARTIKAIVQGNRQYDVSISFDDEDEILCECTCPCDFNCKHAAATMLKWLSIKKNHKNLHGSAHSSKASLDQILKTKSKEELIELFTEIIKKRPEFISLLYVDQQKITSTVKRLFAHFWEEGEVHELIGNLDTILVGIRRNSKVWDKSLLNEIHTCSTIMIEKIENVQDEGQFTIFLEDWFQVYGEIFATIQPTIVDKETFIQHIIAWMNADDYGYDNCFEKALIGMCTCEEDIKLIRNHLAAEEAKYPEDSHYYQQFYLQLYEKVGLTEPYLEIAKQSGLFATAVKKLIGLGKYDEALKICENNNRDNDIQLDLLRIDLLKNK